MNDRTAHFNDYQERAREFVVGDIVFPYLLDAYPDHRGRVTAVYPSIGMVDVEYPNGSKRHPVEELQRLDANNNIDPPNNSTTPGGESVVKLAKRVSEAFVKKSIYWVNRNRKYRASQSEILTKCYCCPKCAHPTLKQAIYKRDDGISEKLLGCPSCLFLIRRADLVGHHTNPIIQIIPIPIGNGATL